MEQKVFSVQGEPIGNIDLKDEVFGGEVKNGAIYYAVNSELANKRAGTASTKTRGEVRGSSAKPWRQKGTGHARSGDRKSPIWVGGGTTFGPIPRSYNYKIPRKMKRAAMVSLLSKKIKDERLRVVEDFPLESGKTKDLMAILKNFSEKERTVLVVTDEDKTIKRAGKNIPWLQILCYQRLNAHDLFYGRKVLLLKKAAKGLNDFYGKEKKNISGKAEKVDKAAEEKTAEVKTAEEKTAEEKTAEEKKKA